MRENSVKAETGLEAETDPEVAEVAEVATEVDVEAIKPKAVMDTRAKAVAASEVAEEAEVASEVAVEATETMMTESTAMEEIDKIEVPEADMETTEDPLETNTMKMVITDRVMTTGDPKDKPEVVMKTEEVDLPSAVATITGDLLNMEAILIMMVATEVPPEEDIEAVTMREATEVAEPKDMKTTRRDKMIITEINQPTLCHIVQTMKLVPTEVETERKEATEVATGKKEATEVETEKREATEVETEKKVVTEVTTEVATEKKAVIEVVTEKKVVTGVVTERMVATEVVPVVDTEMRAAIEVATEVVIDLHSEATPEVANLERENDPHEMIRLLIVRSEK